ncbi:acyltransferase [Lithospermum erythrorhizon]|uniref:Acyltransferase n=1 Tax=Lithospermum erythrorhizon TaxID=34254 RepID=A0AAV3NS43_LITER
MLLHNNISPPFLHTPSTLKTTTTTHLRNLTISSQQQPTTTTTLTGTGPKGIQGISISDKSLTTRGFNFHHSIENLNLDQLNSIFVAVGFPRRDPDKIRVALEHTDALLWVEYEKSKKPIAFARATGDGVFNAIIWDVVVDPSFQGIGLGKAVMERLMNTLLEKGITNIALYSEPRVLGFYRPLGFVADPDGIRGMVYSRKKKNK